MTGETVTVVRAAPATDRYNNVRADWSSASEVDVDGVVVAPRTVGVAGEPTAPGRPSAVEAGLTLWFPAGTPVLATDRLRVRGELWDVDGVPSSWDPPWPGGAPGVAPGGVEVHAVRHQG